MSITLDGNSYSTYQSAYAHEQSALATTQRAVDGSVVRQESGIFANRYRITLRCTMSQLTTLRATFAKRAPGTHQLNFIDEEGFNWNPAAGVNDATHAYSTGIYFETMSDPRPVTGRGFGAGNYVLVDITLIANAKGMTT